MKVIATIRPTETREIEAWGEDYQAARDAVAAKVPAGWQVIAYRAVER
jgi:hypothetical protein